MEIEKDHMADGNNHIRRSMQDAYRTATVHWEDARTSRHVTDLGDRDAEERDSPNQVPNPRETPSKPITAPPHHIPPGWALGRLPLVSATLLAEQLPGN